MRIELGQRIRCSDGAFGEVADVVIDPSRRRVTHLVVEPHHDRSLARLVPAALVAAVGEDSSALTVQCRRDELLRQPAVEEFAYLRFGELPPSDPDWDVGIEDVLVAPSSVGATLGDNPFDLDPHVAVLYDRIPKGEVELRRTSPVVSSDGRRIGRVVGVAVDRLNRITELVVERRRFFARRRAAVPVAAVARLATDSVTLNLTKADVAAAGAA